MDRLKKNKNSEQKEKKNKKSDFSQKCDFGEFWDN